MTTVQVRPMAQVLAGRARGCVDLPALAAAVCRAYLDRIPYEFACLATMDPSTGLISWAWKTHPLNVGDEEFAAAEYGGPDINLFAEIAARPDPVGVLSVDTHGQPQSCRRMSTFLTPRFGFTDELRVVFRSQGLAWGGIAMYRGQGKEAFTAEQGRLAVSAHAQAAALIQEVLFRPHDNRTRSSTGPAVIMIDASDRVAKLTQAAHTRIEQLGGWDNGSLPSTVLVAAAAARCTPDLATTRAIGVDGAWLSLRATTFAPPADSNVAADVVVTIDVASPADIGALALAARGLSAREQEVAGMVLQGAATKAIAAGLFLSPHTVQDHLKSIFAKLGVNSRREMVQQLVLG